MARKFVGTMSISISLGNDTYMAATSGAAILHGAGGLDRGMGTSKYDRKHIS